MQKNKRLIKTAALLLSAALLMSLAGCGGKKEETQSAGTFRVAVLEMLSGTNPFTAKGALAEEIFLLCYDPLWRYDENYDPVACLAESWDMSSDGLTWTIRLREGVRFSDGTPLTSADVKFSYELMRQHSERYAQYLEDIETIICPDDNTVVIATAEVKGDMLYNPTPILPKAIWSDFSENPEDFENASIVGTGPFVYQPALSGEGKWVLSANEDYFDGAPHIRELVFQNELSAATAATALTTGEVSACMELTDAQLTTLEGIGGVELVQSQTPVGGCCVLGMNLQMPGLDDETVRQALEYCVDRTKVFEMAFGGSGVSGSVIYSPGDDFYQPGVTMREFSTEKAAALLESKGYTDADGDNVRESLDGAFELTFTLYTSPEDAWAPTAVTILEGSLSDVGIDLVWKVLDEGVDIYDQCRLGGKWELFLDTVEGDINPCVTAASFYSGSRNATGWTDAQYDGLYSQLLRTLDKDEKVTLCRALQEKVYEQCPWVVLAYPVSIQAVRADLWTGYQEVLTASGGMFGTGTIRSYMTITQNTDTEAKG